MRLVLDTGIIIAFVNEEKDKSLKSVEKIFELTKNGKLQTSISSITISEIYSFFYKRREPKKAVGISAMIEEIGVMAINLDKELAKKGGIFKSKYAISFADAIILATCVDVKSMLITYDKEFSPVKDVQILRPEEFVEMLESPIKMKCGCGGNIKEIHKEIEGEKTKVSVCDNCGKELIDMDEGIRAQKKVRKGKNG
ncbi:MAG: PIN domain-containing protein [Candidatus Aenigmarchaeota archaeon]|nr:PIN domain-containing protein [Candidatus Aenigmarchaeota archaeon]